VSAIAVALSILVGLAATAEPAQTDARRPQPQLACPAEEADDPLALRPYALFASEHMKLNDIQVLCADCDLGVNCPFKTDNDGCGVLNVTDASARGAMLKAGRMRFRAKSPMAVVEKVETQFVAGVDRENVEREGGPSPCPPPAKACDARKQPEGCCDDPQSPCSNRYTKDGVTRCTDACFECYTPVPRCAVVSGLHRGPRLSRDTVQEARRRRPGDA
jgi:hypothetical protein